jgi:hypothetical protein
MQKIPKLVNRNEEKDYATIYEDNFIRKNDPAELGNQAFTRQLGQGLTQSVTGQMPTQQPFQQQSETDMACPPGYERNARMQCVPIQSVEEGTSYVSDPVNPQSAQQGLTDLYYNENIYKKYDEGYGRSAPPVVPESEPETETETETEQVAAPTSPYTQEEQNLYATLDAEAQQVAEDYQRQYENLLARARTQAEARGSLAAQGFGGGIGQQIRDYLSAGEIQQLTQLEQQKDAQLKEIELRRGQVPDLALRNEAERLQLANANMQLKTQFAMDLATSVTSGLKSLDDAQAFADQYGLQNIQDLIISAAKAEIKAGADEAVIKQNLIDVGIDPELVDEEIKDEKPFTEISNDFLGLADKALERADKDEAGMEAFFEASGESGILGAVTGYTFAGLATVFGLNAFFPDFGVGTEDRAVLTTDLLSTDFYQTFGEQLQSEDGMAGKIDYTRDLSTQNAGLGYYNDSYRITVGDEVYTMQGADVITLVATLTAGNFKVPTKLLQLANEVYNKGLGTGFARFMSGLGSKESYAEQLFETIVRK